MIELKSQIRPVLNSNFYPSNIKGSGTFTQTPRGYDIKELMWWVKRTPECIGIGRRIAMDIVSKISFKAIDKKNTGRPSDKYKQDTEDKAKAFAVNENLREKLVAAIFDWVFTGDAYIWHNMMEGQKLKEITAPIIHKLELKKDSKLRALDEDFSALSTIELIPSTTVEIRHNGQKVIFYVQNVLGNERKYDPDNVIHARFMYLDGDIYGFSPMIAAGGVIQSLGYIKDYSMNYFNNGGPDMVFKLPKEMAGSPNHEALKQGLQKYKDMRTKRGNLVFTGELEIEELNKWNKDMEFRQYAIYLTGCLAFAFNMPADIISSILGVDIKGTAMGSDIEDAGYNRNISHSQEYWENLLNSQFFNRYMDVEISFEREYKQEQIRLSQERMQNLPLAEFMFKHKYPVSDEFFHNILQIPRKYLEKGKIKREVEELMATSGSTKPQPGPNQQKYQDQKKAQQKPQERNNPPIGR